MHSSKPKNRVAFPVQCERLLSTINYPAAKAWQLYSEYTGARYVCAIAGINGKCPGIECVDWNFFTSEKNSSGFSGIYSPDYNKTGGNDCKGKAKIFNDDRKDGITD